MQPVHKTTKPVKKKSARKKAPPAEPVDDRKPISVETIHHPDGSVETITHYKPPADWRTAAANLAGLFADGPNDEFFDD